MILFKAFLTALSTYSVIPVRQSDFDGRAMKYAICFFPAVGIIIGIVIMIWYRISGAAGLSGVIFAAAATALPIVITGGIHLDGYMDTVDALSSHMPRERKLAIMKDAHTGAFAVIYVCVYLLIVFALFYELYIRGAAGYACPAFVLSRALSAFAALRLPNARRGGMLDAYTGNAETTKAAAATIITAAAVCVIMIISSPLSGVFAVAFSAAWLILYSELAMRLFGGVTGDTAGFFLEINELLCLTGVLLGAVIR